MTFRKARMKLDGYFNSHPHEEDDEEEITNIEKYKIFQLTSSRRGWHSFRVLILLYKYFNSHPHEEDDDVSVLFCYYKQIISTHILTKRMTTLWGHINIIPTTFQLTSSRRGWRCKRWFLGDGMIISTHILTKRMTEWWKQWLCWNWYFNSHPHEEDDGSPKPAGSNIIISTHILTKRMTVISVFHWVSTNHFNSHPHEEDDVL